MVVLSRKKNETIVINDNITITVVEIRGDKVRLLITSPPGVTVHRQEIYDAIHGRLRGTTEVEVARAFYSGPLPTSSASSDLDGIDQHLANGGKVRFTSEGTFKID